MPGSRLDGSPFESGSCEIHHSLRKVVCTARAHSAVRRHGVMLSGRRISTKRRELDSGRRDAWYCTAPLRWGRDPTLSRPSPLFDECLTRISSRTAQNSGVIVGLGRFTSRLRPSEGDTTGVRRRLEMSGTSVWTIQTVPSKISTSSWKMLRARLQNIIELTGSQL